MRTVDLITIGTSSLWRQKLRTVLTILGVAIGCATLLISLSVGLGVQEAVELQFRREDRLRQISVFPSQDGMDESTEGVPEAVLTIDGEMSEAKRERIRKREIRRWKRNNRQPVPKPLTAEMLETLRQLPHVVSVTPETEEHGRIYLEKRSSPGSIVGLPPNQRGIEKRLEHGYGFTSPRANEAIVHEYLLYRLGKRNESEVRASIGSTIRIELTSARRTGISLLNLFEGDPNQLTEEEVRILEKAWKQLPGLIAAIDLPPEERSKLLNALKRKAPSDKLPTDKKIVAEFTIVGVIRDQDKGEPAMSETLLEGPANNAEVLLPLDTATELFLQLPTVAQNGFSRARIIVDQEAHLQEVVQAIKKLGLNEFSLGMIVQQIRRNVMIIGFGMDFIALVALIVAALGITNTMFTSVLERTREIGIMKAVGAKDRQILTIFLVEGGLIGFFGGMLGALLGWLAQFPGNRMALNEMSKQIQEHDHLPETMFLYPPWLLIGIPLFAMLITTLAALLPARRAARIHPVEALRHE